MPHFRKKPVVIDAFQWTGDFDALEAWLDSMGYQADGEDGQPQPNFYEDHNAQGKSFLVIPGLEDGPDSQFIHAADEGDWIIRGVKGEFYPCKPDAFAASYESAEVLI